MKIISIKRIGISVLLVVIIYRLVTSILPVSFSSKNFPLHEIWSARLGENVQQITVTENKSLLVRTQAALYKLDIETGKVLWKYWTQWPLITEEPALEKNGIVTLTNGEEVVGLRFSDGKLLWRQKYLDETAEVLSFSKDFVAVYDHSKLLLFRTTDGTLQWEKWACRGNFQAYIVNSTIYVPCSGITAYDLHSGELVWTKKFSDRVWESIYADDVIFSSPKKDYISAFDLENRKDKWITRWPNDGIREYKIDGPFLFVTDYQQFCVLDRNNGKIQWCAKGLVYSQNPTKIGEVVYVFDNWQSEIIAFNIANGSILGRLTRPAIKWPAIDTYRQSMVSVDGQLIFGSGKYIFAFRNRF